MKTSIPRATVLIPTYGEARFVEWALKSVQQQTVQDLEICIICDGSPSAMVEFVGGLAEQDPRVRVFSYPKSPRTGEPYRDEVIRQTTGEIICYCGHDDLWLPHHVQSLQQTLADCHLTNSIFAMVNTPEKMDRTGEYFSVIAPGDLQDPRSVAKLRKGHGFFGLTFGAHTREAYMQLPEGWATTPSRSVATDTHMWRKFVDFFPQGLATTRRLTALKFPVYTRASWTEAQRAEELKRQLERMDEGRSLEWLEEAAIVRLHTQLTEFYSVKRLTRRTVAELLPQGLVAELLRRSRPSFLRRH